MKKSPLCTILLAVFLFALIDKSDAQDTTAISNNRAQYYMLLTKFVNLSKKAFICCSSAQCDQTSKKVPPSGPQPVSNGGKNNCWGNRFVDGYDTCGDCIVPDITSPKEMEMGVYRISDEVITKTKLDEQRKLFADLNSLLTQIQSLNISLNLEVAKYSAISIALLSIEKGFDTDLNEVEIESYRSTYETILNAYNEYSKIKQNSEELQQQNSMLSIQVEDFLSAFGLGLEDAIKRSGN